MAKNDRDDLQTVEGLKVEASVGGSDDASAPQAQHDEIRWLPATEELHDYPCGHRAPKFFDYDIFGRIIQTRRDEPAPKCPDCILAEMASVFCRCALCGQVIHPGEPVALYAPSRKFRREWVTEVKAGVIGCLGWDCCPSGGFFAGHWLKGKFRPAFGNGLSSAAQALATGQVVCGNTDQVSDDASHDEVPLKLPTIIVRGRFEVSAVGETEPRPSWLRRFLCRFRGK